MRQDAWDAMYNKLVEYMKKHGHGNVSQHAGKKKKGGGEGDGDEDLEEEERLGKWIKNQLSSRTHLPLVVIGILVTLSLFESLVGLEK